MCHTAGPMCHTAENQGECAPSPHMVQPVHRKRCTHRRHNASQAHIPCPSRPATPAILRHPCRPPTCTSCATRGGITDEISGALLALADDLRYYLNYMDGALIALSQSCMPAPYPFLTE